MTRSKITSNVQRALWACAAGLFFAHTAAAAAAQPYKVGDIVEDFVLINRATGAPLRLSDYAGKIVFLEWFYWW